MIIWQTISDFIDSIPADAGLAMCWAVIIWVYILIRRSKHKLINYNDIYAQVQEINLTIEKLRQLDNIITDINVCSDEHLKGVRIDVPDSISQNAAYDVIINGDDDESRILLEFSFRQRNKLSHLLYRQTKNLNYIVAKVNVREKYRPTYKI